MAKNPKIIEAKGKVKKTNAHISDANPNLRAL